MVFVKYLGAVKLVNHKPRIVARAHISKVVVRESTKTWLHLVDTMDISISVLGFNGKNRKTRCC